MKNQIIEFVLKADYEGGYDEVVEQWPHLVPADPMLQGIANQWMFWEKEFRRRLQQLAEEHEVDIDNPYIYEDTWD